MHFLNFRIYLFGSASSPVTACCFQWKKKVLLVTASKITHQTYSCITPPWVEVPAEVDGGEAQIVPFHAGEKMSWRLVED